MSAATWLTHGLSLWQQVSLVALFAVVFGWALIATSEASRVRADSARLADKLSADLASLADKWSESRALVITSENVEFYVKQWLDNFNLRRQKREKSEKLHFDYSVHFPDGSHAHILHPTERNQYLGIMAHFTLPKRYKELFDTLSEPEKKRFLIGMRAEIHRAGIKPYYKDLFEKVTIEKLLPISALTEADVIEQLKTVHVSQMLVIDTISLSLGFDEQEGKAAIQADESAKHES